MRTLKMILTIVLVFAWALSGCGPSSVHLRLAPPEGETYRYQDSMIQDLTVELMGLEIAVHQTIELLTRVDVIDVNQEGQVLVDVSYEQVAAEVTSPFFEPIHFDSQDEVTTVPPEFQSLAQFVDQTFSMTLDSRGSVLELSGLQEMMAAVINAAPQSQLELEDVLEIAASLYGSNSTSGGLTGMIGPFPEENLAVGDRWTQEVETNLNFPITVYATYTVNSIRGDQVVIQVNGEIIADLGNYISENEMGEMELEMHGGQSGEIILDPATGMLISSTQELSITATAELFLEELGRDTTIVYDVLLSLDRSLVTDE